jgi:hypothetical protein
MADASGATFALAAAVARRLGGERQLANLPANALVAGALALRTADLVLLGPGPAYAPVVVGAAVGWLAAGSGRRAERVPAVAAGRPAAPVGADEAASRARLDALLQKIHEDGLPALTAEERGFLERASRRYRDPPADSR